MKTIISRMMVAVLGISFIFSGQGKSEIPSSSNVADIKQKEYPLQESPSNPELRNLSGEQISISAGDKVIIVDLYDNSAANDLLTRLPITFEISDYAGWDEKLIRLDNDNYLDMADYTGGDEPGIPELGYYEPGNWVALYYGYIGYWSGKIPLGKINATCDQIKALPAGSTALIEKITG